MTNIAEECKCQYNKANSKKFKDRPRSGTLIYQTNTLKCSIPGCPSKIYTGIKQGLVVVTNANLNHIHSIVAAGKDDDVIVLVSILAAKPSKMFLEHLYSHFVHTFSPKY